MSPATLHAFWRALRSNTPGAGVVPPPRRTPGLGGAPWRASTSAAAPGYARRSPTRRAQSGVHAAPPAPRAGGAATPPEAPGRALGPFLSCLPHGKVINFGLDDGRLPMDDHNTRIIVFGQDGAQAVAEAIAQEAFSNVVYFAETFETLLRPTASK